jgi:hypothetical protein
MVMELMLMGHMYGCHPFYMAMAIYALCVCIAMATKPHRSSRAVNHAVRTE